MRVGGHRRHRVGGFPRACQHFSARFCAAYVILMYISTPGLSRTDERIHPSTESSTVLGIDGPGAYRRVQDRVTLPGRQQHDNYPEYTERRADIGLLTRLRRCSYALSIRRPPDRSSSLVSTIHLRVRLRSADGELSGDPSR